MATKTILPVALFFQNPALIEAIAVALAFPPESAHTQCLPSYRTVHTEGGWSRQDMLTLASVCLAIVGIMIGALMASPKAREWLCKPFKSETGPTRLFRSSQSPSSQD